jgi:hypothetical protein
MLSKIFTRILVFAIAVLCVMPVNALADGMIIDWMPRPRPIDENSQVAAINYQDGLQKMIISVNYNSADASKAVWIFPVAASPSRVAIDIVQQFPRFSGTDVVQKAKSDVNMLTTTSSLTQIYPVFFGLFYYTRSIGGTMMAAETTLGGIGGTISGVTVYEYIEKEGMSTEIITASNSHALYDHLRSKGLQIEDGSLDTLGYYIGKDYTFVVSWITAVQNNQNSYIPPSYRQPGIFITFPTDRIYFPLIPTSIYGSKTIPVRVYVLDHVIPDTYNEISSYVSTRYYVQSNMDRTGLEDFFGNMNMENVKYTMMEMSVPSKYFVQDLWFDKGAPPKVNYAIALTGFTSNGLLAWLIYVAAISMLTGLVLGAIFFRDPIKFALLGLANIMTIIGLAVVVAFTRTRRIDEGLRRHLRASGALVITSDTRKIYFIILFSILFLVLTFFVGYLLVLPLG